MENGVMDKFIELLRDSTKWGQTSNSNFTNYIMDENKRLKDELQSFRRESEKMHNELRCELVKLRTRNRVLEDRLKVDQTQKGNARRISPHPHIYQLQSKNYSMLHQ